MCRTALAKHQLTRVSQTDSAYPIDELTNLHGVKMAALIRCLNQILNEDASNRVIVFSQWDDMLTRIGSTIRQQVLVDAHARSL
jgi:ERCC4-related helicase